MKLQGYRNFDYKRLAEKIGIETDTLDRENLYSKLEGMGNTNAREAIDQLTDGIQTFKEFSDAMNSYYINVGDSVGEMGATWGEGIDFAMDGFRSVIFEEYHNPNQIKRFSPKIQNFFKKWVESEFSSSI